MVLNTLIPQSTQLTGLNFPYIMEILAHPVGSYTLTVYRTPSIIAVHGHNS